MNLPPALAPWAPYLADFPLDVRVALGGLAQRLAALLGPNGGSFDQPEGEVDGYDGLSRRGLPERMLLSDWLLADEVPDEWARRAVEGELSYLQLARRAPQVSLVVAALFDAGPDVLGAPRLGQLAALLVLARRAGEMGAELVWGIAQKPTQQLWRGVSPSGAMALLEARGSLPATASDLELWREALGAKALGARDEIWLVGGPEFAELALPDESKLLLEDPFEAVRALDVAAHPHGREVRRARLELPADALCTRLLRDPFGTKTESSAQVRRIKFSLAPASNLVWISANALAARASSDGIVVFRVPSSLRGGVAKPKHYRLNHEKFDFVGEYEGTIVGAQLHGGGVRLYNIGGRAQNLATGFFKGRGELWSTDEMTQPLQPLWNFKTGGYQPVLLLPHGDLAQLVPRDDDPKSDGDVQIEEQEIRVAQGFDHDLIALSDSEPARIVRFQSHARTVDRLMRSTLPEPLVMRQRNVLNAFWGTFFPPQDDSQCPNVSAYQTKEGWFIQITTESFDHIKTAPGETVFGVVGWKTKPSHALLVRGEQGRGLTLRGSGWHHPLAANDAIENAVVSPTGAYLAWTTKNELTTYSLALDTVLARWQWGEE